MGIHFKINETNIWGIQYHPEITYDKMISLINFRTEKLIKNKAFENKIEINKHIEMIRAENKISNKDSRMRELENWLNLLKKN